MQELDAALLRTATRIAYFFQDRFGVISYTLARWCHYVVGASVIGYWGLGYFGANPTEKFFGGAILGIIMDAFYLLMISYEIGYLKKAIDRWETGKPHQPSWISGDQFARVLWFSFACCFVLMTCMSLLLKQTVSATGLATTLQSVAMACGIYFANVVPRPPQRKTALAPALQ